MAAARIGDYKLIRLDDYGYKLYDFWANDILWQLSVFAFNISVPAKITRSGHHIELKMYEHHFYKDAWEELDRLIEAA